jgi:hypothetical protein
MPADRPFVTIDPVPRARHPERRFRRAVGLVVAGVVASAGAAACGDIEDQSLCTAYGELLQTRAGIQELDPSAVTAGAAEEQAKDYLDAVLRLEETGDGRYGTALADLATAVNDVVLTLGSVQADEDYSTWAPLVEDDLEAIANAEVTLDESMQTQCPSTGEEG